jgi:small-conductance mechanosensitive channel
VALAALAVLTSMVAAGIDLTAFAVFGGALGVGIGLGMQRIVSNFVSGFILAFEGSVRVGDRITLNGDKGRITSLHARYMVVHTDDGIDIVVPNENLLTSEVINWSYEGDTRVRMTLPVQIAYRDDPDKVIALLVRLAREHPKTLDEPGPEAAVTGFGENGISLELKAWVEDAGQGGVRSDLYRQIWREFGLQGFTFAYPQREIRMMERSGNLEKAK